MDDDKEWDEPPEENGLTLGPEEYLQREIEKSKSLKVDRLRLRDEIEQLKQQKEELKEKNRQLHQRINALNNDVPTPVPPENSPANRNNILGPLVTAILLLSVLLLLLRN